MSTPAIHNCTHCGEQLAQAPEKDFGDWFIRCLSCGVRNIVNVPVFELIGWAL